MFNLEFESNRQLTKDKKEYYYTSMTPSNWYEWFDPKKPPTGAWAQV